MEKKIFKGFYNIWEWQPFWSMDHTHFSNLSFSCPRRLRMKFEQHWPGGFRGKAIWNYQHFFHTNVWSPYKCIQKQNWPRCKKVRCQCMTTILATLVDRPFQMIYAKILPQGILGWLSWGLTTRQPLLVILCRLPEKGRKETEEIAEEIKGRDREERGTGMKVKKQKK